MITTKPGQLTRKGGRHAPTARVKVPAKENLGSDQTQLNENWQPIWNPMQTPTKSSTTYESGCGHLAVGCPKAYKTCSRPLGPHAKQTTN